MIGFFENYDFSVFFENSLLHFLLAIIKTGGRKLSCKLMPKIQNSKGLEKSGKTWIIMQTDVQAKHGMFPGVWLIFVRHSKIWPSHKNVYCIRKKSAFQATVNPWKTLVRTLKIIFSSLSILSRYKRSRNNSGQQ